jgi:sugar lactone lactonase YvrE
LAGYVLIRIRAPQLLEFSKGIEELQVTVKLDSLGDARFVTGMNGCENVLVEKESLGVYISCLDGYIHYLCPGPSGDLVISKSFKAGEAVTGLAMEGENSLIAAVSTYPINEWKTRGGAMYRLAKDFTTMERISEDFPSLNGICIDNEENLYFASSNFDIFKPSGSIYRMSFKGNAQYQSPDLYIRDAGLANGLFFDPVQDKIFFSNTIGGVFEFSSKDKALKEVYLKVRFMEACDDMCTDISGNVWMTDPGHSTVKMYNPGTDRLTRFVIEGFGQASSCRIRSENGMEMIYITELKQSQQPASGDYNGRGVLIVPAQSLIRLLEPLMTDKNLKP